MSEKTKSWVEQMCLGQLEMKDRGKLEEVGRFGRKKGVSTEREQSGL